MEQARKLLLVDDEQVFLASLAEGLGRRFSKSKIFTAHDGAEALEVLRCHPIDLVVTDLKMPGTDGYALLAAMHASHPHVPAIVMTAYATETTQRRSAQAGAVHCVDKPVDLASLAEDIEATLRQDAGGRLRGVSLFAFLQLLGMERKSGIVEVNAPDGTARLFLRDGVVIDAERGGDRGLSVALRALAVEAVDIELRHGALPRDRAIHMPMTELLLEAARLRDEQEQDGAGRNEETDDGSSELDAMFPSEEPTVERVFAAEPAVARGRTRLDGIAREAMRIEGAVGAAVANYVTGEVLGVSGGTADIDMAIAASSIAALVRAKLWTLSSLAADDEIEDILISLYGQYHLLRVLEQAPQLFVYVVLDRAQSNLAMARFLLGELETVALAS